MTSEEQISIVIDDKRVQTRSGAVALEAAIEAGIYVPYLCYHPGMKPFAACRLVPVQGGGEVEGWRAGMGAPSVGRSGRTAVRTLRAPGRSPEATAARPARR